MNSVQRGEWKFAWAFAAFVMLLTCAPYLAGALRSTDEWRFSGFVVAVEDGNSYLANMQQGAHGAWLFLLPYAYEPHEASIIYLPFILLGKLTGWLVGTGDATRLHAGLVVAFHAARVAGGLAMVLATYRLLAEFLPRVGQRRLALVVTTLGGGLGWALLIVPGAGQPLEFYSPETFGFIHLYALPHLSLSRALMLVGLVLYLRSIGGHWAWALAAGGAWLGMSLIQPLYVLVVYAVVGMHVGILAVMAIVRRETEAAGEHDAGATALKAMRAAAVAAPFGLPMVAYSFFLFTLEPVYQAWGAQNIILSPEPWHYVSAYGLPALAGLLGLPFLYRRSPLHWALVVGWLLALPVLVYIPYNLQRRFAEAGFVPLVAVAVLGLTAGLRRWPARPLRRVAPALFMALTLPATALLLLGGLFAAQRQAAPIFQSRDQVATYEYLGKSLPPRSVVMASYEFSNAVPAYGYLVAYIGHGPETPHLELKRSIVDRILDPRLNPRDRRDLYFGEGVPYLVIGPADSQAGMFDPATQADYLQLIFEAGDYSVWSLK